MHLAVGDEVEYVDGVHPRTGDSVARKLKRIKQAPAVPPAAVVPERNPNAMKFTGNLKARSDCQGFCQAPCLSLSIYKIPELGIVSMASCVV